MRGPEHAIQHSRCVRNHVLDGGKAREPADPENRGSPQLDEAPKESKFSPVFTAGGEPYPLARRRADTIGRHLSSGYRLDVFPVAVAGNLLYDEVAIMREGLFQAPSEPRVASAVQRAVRRRVSQL